MTTQIPTLLVPLRNRHQLFEVYYHRDGADGVFVQGEVAFDVGEMLYIEINFLEEQKAFRLKGSVRWRRVRSGRSSMPPGIGVEFDDGERQARDLVLDFARGREVDFTVRASHRLPVALSISYASDSRFLSDMADDLSVGGVFIATDNVLDVGTELELKLKPPGYLMGLRLRGTVAWASKSGARRGMGVKFQFGNQRQRRKIEDIVDKLKDSIIKDMRIQVPR
ncbi:MAG: TIGR02266 family protein [Pseudomonadota bacterium]